MKMHKTTFSKLQQKSETFFFGRWGGEVETENAFQTSGVYLQNLQPCISQEYIYSLKVCAMKRRQQTICFNIVMWLEHGLINVTLRTEYIILGSIKSLFFLFFVFFWLGTYYLTNKSEKTSLRCWLRSMDTLKHPNVSILKTPKTFLHFYLHYVGT